MRVTLRPRPRCLCALQREGGFTIIEISVAILLVSVGMMGIATSLDGFKKLIGSSSKRTVAAHKAQEELEFLAAKGYKDLVLKSNPGSSLDPKDPRSGVSGSQYRPSSDAPLQELRIDAADTAALDPTYAWQEGDVKGTVYRFITKNTGGSCGTNCPKRVTVAVTIDNPGGSKPDPVTASTVVTEAQDKNADENTPEPPAPPGPSFLTFFPTDTQAVAPPRAPDIRVEPSGNHTVHESDKFPDLMVTDPPPNPTDPAIPPLYKFSNPLDVYTPAAAFPGGRIIKKESNCDNYGDKTKVHWWVTKPLANEVALTGKVGGTIWTQIFGQPQVAGNVILCLTVFEVTKPLKVTNGEFDGGNLKLNANNCSGQVQRARTDPEPYGFGDPIVPRPLSWLEPFLGCGVEQRQVLGGAGKRIAIALTVRDKVPKAEITPPPADDVLGSDAVVLYDHHQYQSTLQLETAAPVTP